MAAGEQLSSIERTRFCELEGIIQRGLSTFVEVAQALVEIRDKRLYRQFYPTFEAYCRTRWHFGSSRARQVMAGLQVVQNLIADDSER
jgi:hypothetical protein